MFFDDDKKKKLTTIYTVSRTNIWSDLFVNNVSKCQRYMYIEKSALLSPPFFAQQRLNSECVQYYQNRLRMPHDWRVHIHENVLMWIRVEKKWKWSPLNVSACECGLREWHVISVQIHVFQHYQLIQYVENIFDAMRCADGWPVSVLLFDLWTNTMKRPDWVLMLLLLHQWIEFRQDNSCTAKVSRWAHRKTIVHYSILTTVHSTNLRSMDCIKKTNAMQHGIFSRICSTLY